jgi:Tfp pilus assembly protein PilO
MRVLMGVLCVLLVVNIIVMGYHGYKLSHVTAEIEAIKEVGRTVREVYTVLGGSIGEKATLAREKIAKIPSFFRRIKERLFLSDKGDVPDKNGGE